MLRFFLGLTLAFVLLSRSVTAQTAPPLADRFHIGNTPYTQARNRLSPQSRSALDAALSRFSSPEKCMTPVPNPQSPTLDWSGIRTLEDARLCFFHMAEELGTPEALANWMRDQGFTVAVHDIFGQWPSDKPATVHATYKLQKSGDVMFPGRPYWLARRLGRSVAVGIGFDITPKPISSTVTINWE